MKIAYIYQEGTNINKANIYQSYSMVKALSLYAEVHWYRGSRKLTGAREFSRIKQRTILNFGLDKFEKLSRLIFCFHTLLVLFLNKPDQILTRDFAFVYFYSKLPFWLKLDAPITFEAHKVYHRVSQKVSLSQEQSAYAVVSRFIAVSEGIKEDLSNDLKIAGSEILVLPNGIEDYESKRGANVDDGKLQFVYAGSYGPWKGVDIILEASNLLDNDHLHITVVGIEEEELPTYNLEILSVLPPLKRDELYKLFMKMDVGIVPTLNHLEGTKYTSPIKFFEYAYARLAILASDIPSIREIEKRGFNIHFFNVGDAKDLAEKMKQIAIVHSENEHNRKLSLNFTWKLRAEEIIKFLSEGKFIGHTSNRNTRNDTGRNV